MKKILYNQHTHLLEENQYVYGLQDVPSFKMASRTQSGIKAFLNDAKILVDCLASCGHNDFYKGVANASTAWLYGASTVNCSLLGIGERTGNVPPSVLL